MYYGYSTLTDIDPAQLFSNTTTSDVMSSTAPDLDDSATGYCTFKTEDTVGNSVYAYDGTQDNSIKSPLPCTQCNQYIYKDDNGECIPYILDPDENTSIDDSSSFDLLCDPAHPERDKNCIQPHGVCTTDKNVSPQTCPF